MKIGVIVVAVGAFALCGPECSNGQQSRIRPILITESGVGPITATTPFSIPVIAKLLPNLRVIAGVSSTEGEEFPTIRVLDGETELFVINPNGSEKGIGSIWVTNGKIVHNGKGRIGSLYSAIYGATISKECFPGGEESTGKVFCRASPSSHIRFVFIGESNSRDPLPSIQVMKAMRVTEMGWIP